MIINANKCYVQSREHDKKVQKKTCKINNLLKQVNEVMTRKFVQITE